MLLPHLLLKGAMDTTLTWRKGRFRVARGLMRWILAIACACVLGWMVWLIAGVSGFVFGLIIGLLILRLAARAPQRVSRLDAPWAGSGH